MNNLTTSIAMAKVTLHGAKHYKHLALAHTSFPLPPRAASNDAAGSLAFGWSLGTSSRCAPVSLPLSSIATASAPTVDLSKVICCWVVLNTALEALGKAATRY